MSRPTPTATLHVFGNRAFMAARRPRDAPVQGLPAATRRAYWKSSVLSLNNALGETATLAASITHSPDKIVMRDATQPLSAQPRLHADHHLRFHAPHAHLSSVFGNDWFALKAEAFARFFGTPTFLVAQTVIVGGWIALNVLGIVHFDIYPFILLNLAFSLQAAYAAPLILLAQTRQADRDKVLAEADAQHREALASACERRETELVRQTEQLALLLQQNTQLTALTRDLTGRIETLTRDVHEKVTRERHAKSKAVTRSL
jgi:uncharacterized membrane protein